MIEKIAAGDRLEVRLKGAEPLNNVPQSLRRLGHLLLSVTIESPACDENIHRLLIEKK
jgi:TusA-related sulfurtransferase